ncbi:hypothetical protein QVD17_06954 [Tagetes erecta]|uniref:Reverse transcriptase domain-containing protein n=1 Tax=Tagetes erecta TaxID=13708 RepID=A0AAD8LLN1_TARER|nr:hypothetical protein QVD17_06954 [Tagetes erecta]
MVNICFEDDLFLFVRGEVQSCNILMKGLEELKNGLGLTPSVAKSTVFFCQVPRLVKQAILAIIPFEEGRLQLLVSVISLMYVYWASVLVMPSSTVKDLERKMKGPLNRFIMPRDIYNAGFSLNAKVADLIWKTIRVFTDMVHVDGKWEEIVQFLISRGEWKSISSIADRLVLGAAAYYVWQERNARLFANEKRTPIHISNIILKNVRMRLLYSNEGLYKK